MGDRLLGDQKITGRVDCGRSFFQREQGRVRGRRNRRGVEEKTSLCSNELGPKPEPNPAVFPQKMPRLTASPNLLHGLRVDRDLGSRFNRDQRHGNIRREHAPDGFRILEDICVVNLDRIPGAETERGIFRLAADKNDMVNTPREIGMTHLEGGEIRQRTERDINHLLIRPQRFGQRLRCRLFPHRDPFETAPPDTPGQLDHRIG